MSPASDRTRPPSADARTLDALFRLSVRRFADKTALVADRAGQPVGTARRFTYRELDALVSRAARSLRTRGIGRGDVVSIQLPNWWEFAVAALAAGRIGAVVNPLLPSLRERELATLLAFGETRALVVPREFRGHDHEAMAARLQPQLPRLLATFVAGGTGADAFEPALLGEDMEPVAPATQAGSVPAPGDAADIALLMFTSGTTGTPKGVLHPHRTLVNAIDAFTGSLQLGPNDVMLASSPLAHLTSYLAVMLQALAMGATAVLQDVWSVERALALIDREGVTATAAATPFLTDLCDAVKAGAARPSTLRRYLCAGAPIPPVLIERAADELGVGVSSMWGMTEAIAATITEPDRAREKSSSTDGRGFAGMETRIVDPEGRPLPAGRTGRLMVRGTRMFQGYLKQPTEGLFDSDGWFDSGDLAFADEEGYIRINGRTKDLLIRGGENIPVFEIEGLLMRHPAVSAVAIVGMPDPRLGERGCAYVTLRDGARFDLEALRRHLAQCEVARTYWPERVEVVAEMPRTPSGKIQKFVLREWARALPR